MLPHPPVSSIQQLRFVADYPGRHQVPRNSSVPLPSKCRPWTEVDTRLELARDFSSRSRTLISVSSIRIATDRSNLCSPAQCSCGQAAVSWGGVPPDRPQMASSLVESIPVLGETCS